MTRYACLGELVSRISPGEPARDFFSGCVFSCECGARVNMHKCVCDHMRKVTALTSLAGQAHSPVQTSSEYKKFLKQDQVWTSRLHHCPHARANHKRHAEVQHMVVDLSMAAFGRNY